MAVEVFGLL